MTTTEKNIVIAEFRGWKLQNNPNERWFNHWFNENGYREDKLNFDNDWILLMSVVEKIESLGFETSLDKNGFFIRINGSNTQSGLFVKSKKDAIFNGCFEFIQWYNQNKI